MNSVDGDEVITSMGSTCLLMRTRLISRVITGVHDDLLRPFGIGSPQFVLLVVIFTIQPATRADIGRFHQQDRSTLTRNLKLIIAKGWAEEVSDEGGGRGRPIVLTEAGKALLRDAEPSWRKGQALAEAVLGERGVAAVMDVAHRILSEPSVG